MIEAPARYMDGETAKVRNVLLMVDEVAVQILIREGDRIVARWPLGDVRQVETEVSGLLPRLRYGEARVTVLDPSFIDGLRWHTRDLKKRDPVPGQVRKVAIWAFGALASVAVIIFVIVPALASALAPVIPVERETALADAALDQIGWFLDFEEGDDAFCRGETGRAALDKMFARLEGHYETDYDIQVDVINHSMVNAFALPGGRVLLFDGLIQKAGSPEEVAGVLGHEIAHVINRDPTRMALQSAGTVGVLGLLLGDFSGGSLALLLGNRVLQASYSQEAETVADEFAVEVMGEAGLPSSAMGRMFERFIEMSGDVDEEGEDGFLSHLASHPNTAGRAAAARAGDVIGDQAFEPVLSADEWQALRSMCKG